MEAAPAECEPAAMDANDFLYMLYTSGSTGKPKGLVHSVAGYLLYCMFTQKVSSHFTHITRIARAPSRRAARHTSAGPLLTCSMSHPNRRHPASVTPSPTPRAAD